MIFYSLESSELSSINTDNTQSLTQNAADDILASEADTTDPFAEHIMLGDSIEGSIIAWISIGIDLT